MIGKKKYIWVMAVTVLFAGIYVIAQDIDEDSLFAMEELTLTDSVEGDLPASDGGEDDLLAELLAGDLDADLDDDLLEEDIPLDALTDADDGDDLGALLEDLDSENIADSIDGIDEDVPVAEEAPAEDFDLGDAIDDLGLDAVEEEPEVADIPEVASEDVSMDDLLGELTADEPAEDNTLPEVEEEPTALAEESLDDLLGELTAEEPTADTLAAEEPIIEEKGVDLEEEIPEIDDTEIDDSIDMDALVAELADEAEDDLGLNDLTASAPAPVEVVEPLVVELLEIAEEPEAVELVEIVEAPKEYIDEMALDDDLFKSLANEAQGDIAASKVAESIDRGDKPALPILEPESDVDDLIEALSAEAEAAVIPVVDLDEMPPTEIEAPVAVAATVAEEELPVAELLELDEIEAPVEIIEAPVAVKRPEVSAFETPERLKRIAA